MKTKKTRDIWDLIKSYKKSTQLQSRYVGIAPTYEWTGLAKESLIEELKMIDYPFSLFYSDVKGQPLYRKQCVAFTTFGYFPQNSKI